MANSMYPAWMRNPNQQAFAERIRDDDRKLREWYIANKPLPHVPPRALPKIPPALINPRGPRRVVSCWDCHHGGLDSYESDICSGCRWIICPACGICSKDQDGCDWLNKYSYYYISFLPIYKFHPYTRDFRCRLLLNRRSRGRRNLKSRRLTVAEILGF